MTEAILVGHKHIPKLRIAQVVFTITNMVNSTLEQATNAQRGRGKVEVFLYLYINIYIYIFIYI